MRQGSPGIHVDEGALTIDVGEARFSSLREIAEAAGVDASLTHLPRSPGGVARALDSAVSGTGERVIVAGLRGRKPSRGLLHGTISQELLRLGPEREFATGLQIPVRIGFTSRRIVGRRAERRTAADLRGGV